MGVIRVRLGYELPPLLRYLHTHLFYPTAIVGRVEGVNHLQPTYVMDRC